MITPADDRRVIHCALHDPTADNLTVPGRHLDFWITFGIKERRQRGPRQPGIVENELLLCRAGEAADLADKFANSPIVAAVLIAGDMGRDITL